jgi:Domain of unknown function (DUF6798)
MRPSPQETQEISAASGDWRARILVLLFLLTIAAFLIMGYHPGLEGDAFYLAAIKRNLNPALFPHDADFFHLQFQATIFDKLIAFSVRLTHLPLAWAVLLWQLAAIFFLLHGCWRIARRCFSDGAAQWAAVSLVAVLLTLPVSGTGIALADQYLHPRTLATAAILAAIVAVIDRRIWLAGFLLAVAFSVHAIMAAFGISLCLFLLWTLHHSRRGESTVSIGAAIVLPIGVALPFSWIFEPSSDAWRQAAATRSFYFVTRWEWYEWVGIFAPLLLLMCLQYLLRHRAGNASDGPALVPLLSAVVYYGIFQTVAGLLIMLPPSLERLRPFEPMRYLHLLYLFFFLLAGGLLGRYILRCHLYRWALLFVPLAAGMFYAQLEMFPATAHLELPCAVPKNPWLEAFAWIRQNTPVDSLFALDPHYVELPGEDYHGFRALAERSVLADYVKDGGMAARVPRLAPRWLKEVQAQTGWKNFQAADFERLKQEFSVNWIIVSQSTRKTDQSAGLTCLYENRQLRVCRLY